MRKMIFQVSKNDKMIFSLAWNKYHVYWLIKGSCFDFFADGKNGLFWAKRMMEMWYLLITEKLFFRPFQRCEIQSFWSQKVDGKIFTDYWKALFLNLSVMGNIVFFEPKSWWKDYMYLVFLSYPWYSRTWAIRFLCSEY